MSKPSLMQQALGEQWQDLPASLQAHYQETTNTDIGALDIDYPRAMQAYLSFMRLLVLQQYCFDGYSESEKG